MAGNSMSGRHRKPTVMKVLEGTLRKDRLNPDEPKPEVITIPPPMPPGLSKAGQAQWKKLTLELSKIGLLTTIDLEQLAAYCNEISGYWEAEKKRKKEKSMAKIRAHFDMSQKHLKAAKDLAVQFGFTPASRSKISVPKKEKRSELDEL